MTIEVDCWNGIKYTFFKVHDIQADSRYVYIIWHGEVKNMNYKCKFRHSEYFNIWKDGEEWIL